MSESFKFTSLASNPAVTLLWILCLWIQHPGHSTAREYRLQRRVLNITFTHFALQSLQLWSPTMSQRPLTPMPRAATAGKRMAQLPVFTHSTNHASWWKGHTVDSSSGNTIVSCYSGSSATYSASSKRFPMFFSGSAAGLWARTSLISLTFFSTESTVSR